MHHVLWIDLLHAPDIGGIGWAVKLMTGSLLPAVKRKFKIPHVVLASQHGMLLHPDDALGEVQALGLQDWRIVAAIAVAAPDVEAAARHEYPRHVAEPSMKKFFELRFGDEVISQRPVLGSQFLGGCL